MNEHYCHICKKQAPVFLSQEWIMSEWMSIQCGDKIEAVFCPDHKEEGTKYWDENHRGKGVMDIEFKKGD